MAEQTPALGFHVGMTALRHHAAMAVTAEREGFESIWVPDHLALPLQMRGAPRPEERARRTSSEHPYLPADTPVVDAFLSLAHLAASTSSILLGTSVYVPALRSPLVVARAVQTLAELSGDRFHFGVGSGWLAGEFAALGIDFGSRGIRLDESIDAVRRLLMEDVVTFEGQTVAFEDVAFSLGSERRLVPPIHIGGASSAAMERAAMRGDGWMPNDQTPATIGDALRHMSELREQHGTADRPFEVAVSVRNAEQIPAWQSTGVDRLIVGARRDPETGWRELERAADYL